MRWLWILLICWVSVVSPPRWNVSAAQRSAPQGDAGALSLDTSERRGTGEGVPRDDAPREPFGVEEIAATSTWVQSTGVVDWLGPLAPVALSPFFGITCLSALSMWGPEWVTDNALLGASGPLRNEVLFVIFLILTVVTSVPRLTKVSKPFAQAVDRLETYAVIIILLSIKIFAVAAGPADAPVAMVQLGVLSFTLDTLLAIAMVVNILVINSVKFFFEFMVWLTPIPMLDAVFEVCNKTLSAGLMAIYAFSPTVATVINLVMLCLAALVLRWISRRVRFYRTMVLDPVIARLWSGFGKPKRPELIVFPRDEFGPFPAKSRLRLVRTGESDSGWSLEEANWWLPQKRHSIEPHRVPRVTCGWVMNTITLSLPGGDETVLCFSRRYDERTLAELTGQLGLEHRPPTEQANGDPAGEFA